jgi:tRNA A-37 threonylcarbamoyl transferase component Bud32
MNPPNNIKLLESSKNTKINEETPPTNLKRVLRTQNYYSNPNNIQIEKVPIEPVNPQLQPLPESDSFNKSGYLGKRNKIRSEDSESLVMNKSNDALNKFSTGFKNTNQIKLESNKNLKIEEEKNSFVNNGNQAEEGLEVDSKLVLEYQESLKNKPIPAIKMTLRIFETLPKSFYKKYDCVKEIGKGAYGTVYKGVNNLTKQFVAIKRISLRNKIEDFNELSILKEASHPNIITPLEYCVYEKNLYIVSEFCEGGSLFQRILKKKSLNEDICKKIMISMLGALNYCHNVKNIVHRDIKPENMVFANVEDEDDIRLIDFGLSTMLSDEEYLDKKCGSAFYLAPEVLKGQYNSKCDIWSLGVVMFVLLTGRPLIYGRGQKQILAKVYGLKSVDKLVKSTLGDRDPLLIDFLLKMLVIQPKDRWNAENLLKHDWIVSNQVSNKTDKEGFNKTMSKFYDFFKVIKIRSFILILREAREKEAVAINIERVEEF